MLSAACAPCGGSAHGPRALCETRTLWLFAVAAGGHSPARDPALAEPEVVVVQREVECLVVGGSEQGILGRVRDDGQRKVGQVWIFRLRAKAATRGQRRAAHWPPAVAASAPGSALRLRPRRALSSVQVIQQRSAWRPARQGGPDHQAATSRRLSARRCRASASLRSRSSKMSRSMPANFCSGVT